MNIKCKKCGVFLTSVQDLISFYPSGEMSHTSCCNNISEEIITENTQYRPEIEQNLIDIQTLKSYERTSNHSLFLGLFRALKLTTSFLYLYAKCLLGNVLDSDFYSFISYCFDTFNINMNLINYENLKFNNKLVYIGTHHSFYDAFVMGKLLCKNKFIGFVANETITQTPLNVLLKYCPIILTTKKNTISRITDFIQNVGSFAMFPSGFFSNGTIPEFKNGAFVLDTDYEIQPIVLKYEKNWTRINILDMLTNTEEVNLDVFILETTESKDKNEIRNKMSEASGMKLSRISL